MAGEIKHEWNGTVLTITSDSGTSSVDLKGEKGDTGCRGPQGRAGVILNGDGTIDWNGYATETYVDEQITRVNTGGSIDLSNYTTKTYVDKKIADIEAGNTADLNNYYTKAQTENAISTAINAIEFPVTDLSNYYTKTETDSAIQTAIEKIDISNIDLTNYYTKSEVDAAIPTHVSQLTNDAGYLTEHQSLADYATKTYVDEAVANAGGGSGSGTEVDLSNYYTKAETDSAIDTKIAAIPETDLSTYALKSEIPTKVSVLENDSDYATKLYLSNAIANFTTMSDVEGKGYQTADQVNQLIHNVVPSVTTSDAGKILTVSDSGKWIAKTLVNLEEVRY